MSGRDLVVGIDEAGNTCACGCIMLLALLAAAAWGLWALLT